MCGNYSREETIQRQKLYEEIRYAEMFNCQEVADKRRVEDQFVLMTGNHELHSLHQHHAIEWRNYAPTKKQFNHGPEEENWPINVHKWSRLTNLTIFNDLGPNLLSPFKFFFWVFWTTSPNQNSDILNYQTLDLKFFSIVKMFERSIREFVFMHA